MLIKKYLKMLNDPNRNIRNMFKKSDALLQTMPDDAVDAARAASLGTQTPLVQQGLQRSSTQVDQVGRTSPTTLPANSQGVNAAQRAMADNADNLSQVSVGQQAEAARAAVNPTVDGGVTQARASGLTPDEFARLTPEEKATGYIGGSDSVATTVYHGGKSKIDSIDGVLYVSPDKAQAQAFGRVRGAGDKVVTTEFKLSPDAKIKDIPFTPGQELKRQINLAKQEGYDAVRYSEMGIDSNASQPTLAILNKDVLSSNAPLPSVGGGDMAKEAMKYKSAEDWLSDLAQPNGKFRYASELKVGEKIQVRPPDKGTFSDFNKGVWYGDEKGIRFNGSLNGEVEVMKINQKTITVKRISDGEVLKIVKEARASGDVSQLIDNGLTSTQKITDFWKKANQSTSQ